MRSRGWRSFLRPQTIRIALLSLFSLGALGILIILAMFAWYSRDLPNPDALLTREISQSTKIYDRTGERLLYEVAPDQNRTLVKIEDIPQHVKDAVVTAEDRNFYEHHGIDYLALVRAVVVNTLHFSRIKGTSTITQQLVKNAILTSDRSMVRKIKEIMLSIALEKKFTKDQILQLYLNEIGYGSTNYGVEAASRAYFDKSVKDVTLAEAAVLAALPNQPSRFLNDPEALKERRDWILENMEKLGYANHDDVVAALSSDTPVIADNRAFEAPHFVQWVKGMLEETYGARTVETGGLSIITTLDLDKQHFAEEAVVGGVAANGERYGFANAGLLALDPKTGEILAMVGSPDFTNADIDGQVNVTLQPLQPGSSIKPIVYAAAFAKGYTPETLLWDVLTTFPTDTEPYTPKNYDEKEHGLVTMRSALQGSLNIPAVKTLYLVGIDQALTFARNLGYSTLNDASRVGLSMVLGGAEVTMIDHVAAYAVFANNGIYHKPYAVLKVVDADGKVLEEHPPEKQPSREALNSTVTSTLSNVLSDNAARTFVFGAQNYLTLGDRPAAAKTGTTNNYKDAWTVGYTPSLVAGVWVGNARGTTMSRGADGSKIAAPIWNEFMKKSLSGTAIEAFPEYIPVHTGKSVLDGILPYQSAEIDTVSGKLATEYTPSSRRQTLSCGEFHTILTYVDKDNPQGPPPENPSADPYYSVFEQAIAEYIVRHNASLAPDEAPLTSCSLPTERDDVHIPKNLPTISVILPSNGSDVARTFQTTLQTHTVLPFKNVAYFIDGIYFATSLDPFGETITLPDYVAPGQHILGTEVRDAVDNTARAETRVNVSGDGAIQGVSITNPFAEQKIDLPAIDNGGPQTYTIVLEQRGVIATSLTLSVQNQWTGTKTVIGSLTNPSAIAQIAWTIPDTGDYIITVDGVSGSGQKVSGAPVTVHVRRQ